MSLTTPVRPVMPSAARPEGELLVRAAPLVAAMAAGVFVLAALWGRPLNHDTSWYLVATPAWLDGADLYTDIMEINPPLAFYLTAPAIWLSRVFGVSPSDGLILLLGVGTLLSVLVTLRVMDRGAAASSGSASWLRAGLVATALAVLPLGEAGQREHAMLLLAAPYLTYLAVGAPRVPLWQAVLLGVAGGVGLALKPYFLAAPVIASVVILAGRGPRAAFSPASLAAAATCSLYPVFVFWAHPDYFENVLPMAAATYEAIGTSAPFRRVPGLAAMWAFVLLAALRLGPGDGSAPRWAALTIGFLLTFVLQQKGWGYHALPFLAVLALWIAALAGSLWASDRRPAALASAAVCAILSLTGALSASGARSHFEATRHLAASVPTGGTMLVLSTNVWASFPLANEANARFAGRYPHLWPLPAPLVRTRTGACEALGRCEADERLLDQLRDEIVADWIAGDPALVLIDKRERKSYLGDDPFDYEAFLASHPRWAEMRARYDEHGIVAGYAVLRRLPKTQNRHAP